MNKSSKDYDLMEILTGEVSMDELYASVETWFDALSPESRGRYHDLGNIIQRIKKDGSFDHTSMQSFLSSILEVQEAGGGPVLINVNIG
ncbi:hypothetical protein [Epilithonimonas caeni]|uniref:hypothetical protein n=1 Tax=Epilithonimonas caeni TaxID=365343 RepID=UPI0004872A61|nr:hypothetical protein [Epilithonimonas caeni]